MRTVRTTALLAALAAVVTLIPAGQRAVAAKMCPQNDMEFCVRGKDGFVHTAWTNHCFAKESGERVLHRGACKAKH